MMPQRPAAIECQQRDIALMRDLFVSRVMTLAHIAALHFDGRREAAKKRVQKLKAAGLLTERPRKARDPGILLLAKAAWEFLQRAGHLSEYPQLSAAAFERRSRVSDLTIRHELEVMDAKTALATALFQLTAMEIVEFSTWPRLCEFDAYPKGRFRTRVKPDGLLRVREQISSGDRFEHSFFLELDRGTETLETLAHKAVCYRDHYASGSFAQSFGAPRSAYTEYPFRVLMVFPGEERRNNMAARLISGNPPIETQVWLTTLAELRADPLGPIWIRPTDYRAVVAGTTFDAQVYTGRSDIYRRRPEREDHVRGSIRRHALFQE